jgi:hypothetical protein
MKHTGGSPFGRLRYADSNAIRNAAGYSFTAVDIIV